MHDEENRHYNPELDRVNPESPKGIGSLMAMLTLFAFEVLAGVGAVYFAAVEFGLWPALGVAVAAILVVLLTFAADELTMASDLVFRISGLALVACTCLFFGYIHGWIWGVLIAVGYLCLGLTIIWLDRKFR